MEILKFHLIAQSHQTILNMKTSALLTFILGGLVSGAFAQEKKNKIDPEVIKRGSAIYMRTCVACHQPNGKGLPNVFPPLDGSDWVSADPSIAIKIVLKGLQGPIKVNGQNFASMMPPVMPALNDKEIADVLSYVHASWSNDLPEVTEEQVKKVREEVKDHAAPFTAAELGR